MTTLNAITSPAPALVTTVDSTGNLVLQAVNSIQLQSGSNTATMPAAAGTVLTTGAPQSGGVIQVVYVNYQTYTSTTSSSFVDTGLQASITPKFSTSKILAIYNVNGLGGSGTAGIISFGLTDGSNNILYYSDSLLGYNVGSTVSAGEANGIYLHSPATTSSFTYKVRFKAAGGTAAIGNYTGGASQTTHSIVLMEIAA